MLIWRLVLGAVFIAAISGLCWLDNQAATPGIWLFPLALLLAVVASEELISMMDRQGSRPAAWAIYAGNALIVAANWFPHYAAPGAGHGPFDAPALAFVFSLLMVLLAEMARYREPGRSTLQLATAVFALTYVGWLLTFLVELRFAGGTRAGMAALVSTIVVVKMCDIGAYTVGRLIGRHKMAPRLSSGKTMEGLAGGLAFACLGSWFAFYWIVPGFSAQPAASAAVWIAFGLAVGVAGVVGDLAESLLKRDLGCKDSSTWMPGFGGVLDTIDSLLVAAPVAYVAWMYFVL